MPVSQIVLNSTHYDKSSKTFKYRFPSRPMLKEGDQISLDSAHLFNSFFNVTSSNNTISVKFPSGTGYYQLDTTIEEGYYSVEAMNYRLQKLCYDNKLYVESTNGKIVYFFNLYTSETQYAIVLQTYATTSTMVPPANAPWSQVTSQRTMQFKMGFGSLYGFDNVWSGGTTSASTYTISSTQIPQIDRFNAIVMRCNLCNNPASNPPDFLYSMPLNAAFGSLMSSPQHAPMWSSVVSGQPEQLTIQLCENDLTPLSLIYTNALLVVNLKH